jgi:hypothetical protein
MAEALEMEKKGLMVEQVITRVTRSYNNCISRIQTQSLFCVNDKPYIWILMQVATQYLLPELAVKSLTTKPNVVVADAFVTRFGNYVG